MTRRKKKVVRKKKEDFGDVTLNMSANAPVSFNRPRKMTVTNAVKVEADNRAWDEKLGEFDDFDFVETTDADGTTSVVSVNKNKKKTEDIVEGDDCGREFPLDIWYLISEHIRPEDVGRFGAICRSSYTVICSAKFWFDMYKRYYRFCTLPERLQPECMVRLYGLKSCVIRSLFYMYKPFILRVKRVDEHPHCLLRHQCHVMWHTEYKDKWVYSFKMKPVDLNATRPQQFHHTDLLEALDDVAANAENDCRLLRITSPHFVQMPNVMGLTLSAVSLMLAQGFRHYRLLLRFGPALSYAASSKSQDGMEIVVDPVVNVQVLDWWHPLYPHCQMTPLIDNEE